MSEEEIDVVEKEIRTGLMMIDAGYSINIRDIAKVALSRARTVRDRAEIKRNQESRALEKLKSLSNQNT